MKGGKILKLKKPHRVQISDLPLEVREKAWKIAEARVNAGDLFAKDEKHLCVLIMVLKDHSRLWLSRRQHITMLSLLIDYNSL